MHCILHIGTDKTGSSALQEALAAQRVALLERGVCYPLAGALFGRRRSRHAGFRFAFEELEPSAEGTHGRLGLDTREGIERHRSGFVQDFDRECARLGPAARVILSDEDLFVTSNGPMMRGAHRFLRERFERLTLVIYLRDVGPYLASAYGQQILMGRTLSLAAFADAFLEQGGLARRIAAWQDLFGPQDTCIVRYALESLHEGDVVADFSRRFDLGLARRRIRANRSLRPAGVDLLRTANRLYGDGRRPAWVRAAVQALFRGDALPLLERLPPPMLARLDGEARRLATFGAAGLDARLESDPAPHGTLPPAPAR